MKKLRRGLYLVDRADPIGPLAPCRARNSLMAATGVNVLGDYVPRRSV